MGYYLFAYQLPRSNFTGLISLYCVLFLCFWFLVKAFPKDPNPLFALGILFRILLIGAVPNLSQDFYRFIWDGRLLLQGYNPYLHLPNELIHTSGFLMPEAQILHEGMGTLSAGHYSNYPPINQFFFALAALLAGKSIMSSVMVFKIIIIGADVGTYLLGKKILQHFNLPKINLFYYFLNPLVIIELSGNLHFEGVMIFFLLLSFYWMVKQKQSLSAISMAFSIAVKLVPLMLLPILWHYFSREKIIRFYALIGITLMLLFLPFLSGAFLLNYANTIALWFVNFEFNASIYYLLRGLGYVLTGYNLIPVIGRITPFVVMWMILRFSQSKDNLSLEVVFKNMLLVLSLYFFMSTTVHPWYVITPLVLSIFTPFRFVLIWSLSVMLSYSAYGNVAFKENYWLLGVEYGVVFLAFYRELAKNELLSVIK
ncbi:mannosyltransferase [Haliscomenobacter sp.]|uniref:mannosyltransferase n=1 Tax=Haliscomenobacter sp. TaxID=2717303 RepID=UPI0035931519